MLFFSQTVAAASSTGSKARQKRPRTPTVSIPKYNSIGSSNSARHDHNSGSKEPPATGSDFQSSRTLLQKSSDDWNMTEFEEDEAAMSDRVNASTESNYDYEDSSSDDQFIEDRIIPSKEHSLGSLEFLGNHESQANEFLEDGIVSSDDKRNPLYELRRNPKPSQRFTDQEFTLEALAANPAIAFLPKRSGSWSPDSRARPCSECGKVFWSWKALFGHMRCHPEREWRGIQPPESGLELEGGARIRKRSPAEYSFAENSELDLESDVENKEGREVEPSFKIPVEEENPMLKRAVEARNKQDTSNKIEGAEECIISKRGGRRSEDNMLREFMDDWTPRWPTGKRSKRRRSSALGVQVTSTPEPELTSETTSDEFKDQQDIDTANCLVMLAAAGNRLEELERNLVESTEESAFSDSGRAVQQGSLDDSEEALEEGEADVGDDVGDGRELADDILATTSRIKYECSTCKRCFNSHQALGGHRASHRKMKGCFARTNLTEEVQENDENITEEEFISSNLKKWQMQVGDCVLEKDAPAVEKIKQLKAHECSICHRVFMSGQALGGHKRCHWTGDKTGEKLTDTASFASSNKQPALPSEGNSRKIKEDAIDLNLPAPPDDDDEVNYGLTQLTPVICQN